jgi:hypothetical protein
VFPRPYLGSELDHERQSDMLAQAARPRLVRRLRDLARTSRPQNGPSGGWPVPSTAAARRCFLHEPHRRTNHPK